MTVDRLVSAACSAARSEPIQPRVACAAIILPRFAGRGTVGHFHGAPLEFRHQLFCRTVVRVSFTPEARPFSGAAVETWREYGVADVLDSGEDAAAEVIFDFFWAESDILRTVRLRGAMRDAGWDDFGSTRPYATTAAVSKAAPTHTVIVQRLDSVDFSMDCDQATCFDDVSSAYANSRGLCGNLASRRPSIIIASTSTPSTRLVCSMVWWFGVLSSSNSSITTASLPRNEFDSASDSLVDFRTGQGLQKADVRLLRDGERVGGAETVACFGACVRLDCMLPQEGGAGDATHASGDTPSVPASGAPIRVRTAGGREAIVLEKRDHGYIYVELDGNANDEGGAGERKSFRRPHGFAPGQDHILNDLTNLLKYTMPSALADQIRENTKRSFERLLDEQYTEVDRLRPLAEAGGEGAEAAIEQLDEVHWRIGKSLKPETFENFKAAMKARVDGLLTKAAAGDAAAKKKVDAEHLAAQQCACEASAMMVAACGIEDDGRYELGLAMRKDWRVPIANPYGFHVGSVKKGFLARLCEADVPQRSGHTVVAHRRAHGLMRSGIGDRHLDAGEDTTPKIRARPAAPRRPGGRPRRRPASLVV